MKQYTRDELKEMLLKDEYIIGFTKVNGDKRTMPCTLNESLMPEPPKSTTEKKTKAPNLDVLNVWCTDKKAWRSFRIKNLTSIDIVEKSSLTEN